MWRLCGLIPMSRRESGALCFWSLQTRLNDDCAIPVGCDPDPFVDVGLPFFAVDDGDVFPPGDEPFPAGEARFDMGPPGKVYDAPGAYMLVS